MPGDALPTGELKVAIVTDFWDDSPSLSLVQVVAAQARMLEGHVAQVTVFARHNACFSHSLMDLDWRATLPIYGGYTNQTDTVGTGFESDALDLLQAYQKELSDYDVIIAHDLLVSSWHLPHNRALRELSMIHPNKRYLAWCHSALEDRAEDCKYPSTLRFEGAPGWNYVFPSHEVAIEAHQKIQNLQAGIWVNNVTDPREWFDFSEDTVKLIDDFDLFNSMVTQVYPFETWRWQPKGIPTVLKIFGKLEKSGMKVKLILANSRADSSVAKKEVEKIKQAADEAGLSLDNLVITSLYNQAWERAVPRRVVRELFQISNLFIFPSTVESGSLVLAEAMLSGCLIVGSGCPATTAFLPSGALWFDFSSNPPDRSDFYYERVARNIAKRIYEDAIISTRRSALVFSNEYVWHQQMKPLLENVYGDS